MIIKAFNIGNTVTEIDINGELNTNIENIFSQLIEQEDLKTTWYLDTTSNKIESNPIYRLIESADKTNFDYIEIAEKLRQAEEKSDGTRNMSIREGVLFIKCNENYLSLMKLEKQEVIDKTTFKQKVELSILKNYFKIFVYNGDYNDIKVIDKNRTTAKYWCNNFLELKQCEISENNTNIMISLLEKDELFNEQYNIDDIKDFAEQYIIENHIFDKTELFDKITEKFSLEINGENELFSIQSRCIDSEFEINSDIVNKKFKKKIQVSDDITIFTNNYIKSIRRRNIVIDRQNKQIIIVIDDKYLNKIAVLEETNANE